jgi:hypothetical protein
VRWKFDGETMYSSLSFGEMYRECIRGILFCWASVVFGYETCGRVANSCVDVSFHEARSSIIDDQHCSNQA